jgi:tetratricopeptide (TPR) repeat protein
LEKPESVTFALMFKILFMHTHFVRFRFLSALLFFGAAGVSAVSQTADSLYFEQTFSFSPYSNPRNDIVNHFLLKIAEGNGKLRAYTKYTFKGTYAFSGVRHIRGACVLGMQIHHHGFTGDVHYRDFSLEKMLVPDKMSAVFTIRSPGGHIVFERVIPGVDLQQNGQLFLEFSLPELCQYENHAFELSYIEFYYSDAIYSRFDTWLRSHESYYASIDMLEKATPLLETISFDDPEKLLLEEFRLCEVEQMIAFVTYAGFHEWIDLANGDPDLLLPRYLAMGMQVSALRDAFNRAISGIDTLYYDKARMFDHDPFEAQRLFRQALVYNPFHIPSNLAVANHDLVMNHKDEALLRLARVHAVMYPLGEWKLLSDELTHKVIQAVFKDVDELAKDGRFLDALKLLDQVEQFCHTAFARYDCPSQLFTWQSLVHQGMFRSFVTVSERALRNNNTTLSLTYLRSAIAYQKENTLFVPDRSGAVNLLQKLVDSHNDKGEKLYAAGEVLDAAESFLKAREICDEFPFLNCK